MRLTGNAQIRSLAVLLLGVLVVSAGIYTSRAQTSPPATCSPAAGTSHIPAHPIVAFGDSITWGIGASLNCLPGPIIPVVPARLHLPGPKDTTYPAYATRLLRTPVLNYGLPGEETSAGLSRLQQILTIVRPSVVLILEGVNDLYLGSSPSGVTGRLSAMITVTRKAHARPILLTLTRTYFPASSGEAWINQKVVATNRLIHGLGKQRRVRVIDLYRAFPPPAQEAAVMRHADGSQDFLHPGDAGYGIMARSVFPALRTRVR